MEASGSIFNDDNHRDMAFSSHLQSVVPLRKMSLNTIRKYSKTTDFVELLNKTVNEIFAQMLAKEGINRPFKPQSYCHELVMNEMYTNFGYPSHYFGHDMRNLDGIYAFIPIARYFMANPFQKLQQTYNKCFKYTINELQLRENYDESNGRDFCSQFIDAKRRAEAEEKPYFQCLNDNNIVAVVMDIDWQQIMRNEVNDSLGDRAPVVTDKHHLHNVMAFIYETIRCRNAGPVGSPHMTLSDTILGGKYRVPGQTILIHHSWHILTNDKYFPYADQFKPERFIDKHGQFNSTGLSTYLPFGTGRRVCIGESMAINSLFLIMVNILQYTNDHPIKLVDRYNDADSLQPVRDGMALLLKNIDFEILNRLFILLFGNNFVPTENTVCDIEFLFQTQTKYSHVVPVKQVNVWV
ncbi:unnamed protein product [Medioppia subpectinata]|uniref:Cytochrome P450 n=1 Tax=Medioppia subpectinata TaxID=1979941 RepID=A0A7R9L3U8_9ACAR|nr:unnamed protein product [Medioppia subpectinata]CAG2115069.1 unnamed protein product [Medioppia subpectinata]